MSQIEFLEIIKKNLSDKSIHNKQTADWVHRGSGHKIEKKVHVTKTMYVREPYHIVHIEHKHMRARLHVVCTL